jgi:hypothetical protein
MLEEHASNVWGTWKKYLTNVTIFTVYAVYENPVDPGLSSKCEFQETFSKRLRIMHQTSGEYG